MIRQLIIATILFVASCTFVSAQGDSTVTIYEKIKETEISRLLNEGNKFITSNPNLALEYGLQALINAKKHGTIQDEAAASRLFAEANYSLNQVEKALRYYNRALSFYEQLANYEQQALTLIGIAKVYISTKNSELAQQFLEKAERIPSSKISASTKIDIMMLLGQVYQNQNNHNAALSIYNKIFSSINSLSGLTISQQNSIYTNCFQQLGEVNKNLGNFEQCLQNYTKAAELLLSMHDTLTYEQTLRDIALANFLLEKYTEAYKHFELSYKTSQSISDTSGMILSLQGLGDVHFEQSEIYQAINFYTQQQLLAEQHNDITNTVTAMVKLSQCHFANNDYPTSSAILNKALDIATRENLTKSKTDVYRYLALLYEKNGRYKNALECFKMWIDLRDSVYNNITGQKLAKLQILYDITQKERENESLRQNAEIQKFQLMKSHYQRIILLSLVIAFVVLSVFLIMLFRAKQKEIVKQEETQQKISDLNKALEKRMIQEIKKQEKQQQLLAQKSKLESLGNLAAGIAHEINQPLGGISMGLDNILLRVQEQNCPEEYLKNKINTLFNNVDRIKKIIDHVRNFSRAQKPITYEQVNVNDVVRNALFMVSAQYENHGVSLTIELDEQIGLITADKYKLEQVLLNLLSNAKYAIEEKNKLQNNPQYRKQIDIKTWKDSNNIYIGVRDNGTGIPQKVIDKIFDPFFTTKEEEQGTGLGLAISYGFIKDFLGELHVESKEGEYTYFEIEIPRA